MRRGVRSANGAVSVAERGEGREEAEEALERIHQRLREASVKFGLGELSPSTYALLKKRLEAERAELEAKLIDEPEPA